MQFFAHNCTHPFSISVTHSCKPQSVRNKEHWLSGKKNSIEIRQRRRKREMKLKVQCQLQRLAFIVSVKTCITIYLNFALQKAFDQIGLTVLSSVSNIGCFLSFSSRQFNKLTNSKSNKINPFTSIPIERNLLQLMLLSFTLST